MSGGIWGLDDYGRPIERDTAADADVARTAGNAAGGLVRALWAPIQKVGDIARGQSAVFDPETGHVRDDIIHWGASQAMGRLPARYSAPLAVAQQAPMSGAPQMTAAPQPQPQPSQLAALDDILRRYGIEP